MSARPLPVLLLTVLATWLVGAAAVPAGADARPRLRAFEDCPQLVRYGTRHARRYAPGTPPPRSPGAPGPTPAPVASPGETAGDDVSSTNIQEAGVREPDTVKTDGRTVFALAGGRLRTVDVSGETPRLAATLDLGGTHGDRMFLDGDQALVFSFAAAPGPGPAEPGIASWPSGTRLTLLDVSDPARPQVVRTLDVDGSLISARRTKDTVRVVLSSTPRGVTDDGAPAGRARAWVPRGTFARPRTDRTWTRRLVRCRAIRRPRTFAGLQTITVLTIDLDRGLDPVDADAVLSGGETVYASQENLYVATRRHDAELQSRDGGEAPAGVATEVHRFEAVDAGTTRYRGSGRVPGFLLSQFSMSEHQGVLRVASTDEPPWFTPEPSDPSQSFVTTLAPGDGRLTRIGQVGGLGEGERIYAVRFLGDVGYVVTFRQVDPLYVVDLADPAAPRVRGELKILGYSAYLHPLGDGRLLGIGQDATEEGRRLGTQVSLFDVSDLDAPRLLAQARLGDGSSSAVEWDHHAFLWWPRTGLAVVPLTQWHFDTAQESEDREPFMGAVGFSVDEDALTEAGRISHPAQPYAAAITRSVVVRDRLYTLSDAGLGANRLDTLAPVAWVPFD